MDTDEYGFLPRKIRGFLRGKQEGGNSTRIALINTNFLTTDELVKRRVRGMFVRGIKTKNDWQRGLGDSTDDLLCLRKRLRNFFMRKAGRQGMRGAGNYTSFLFVKRRGRGMFGRGIKTNLCSEPAPVVAGTLVLLNSR
jgi:hypothetical protein